MSYDAGASRDEIARTFLYETHMFDTPAEIAANPEHHLVKAAYRAADRLLTHLGNERSLMPSDLSDGLPHINRNE